MDALAAQMEGLGAAPKQVRREDLPDFTTGEWCTLYPIYLDKDKSVAAGRRIPKDLCLQYPVAEELAEVVTKTCALSCLLEQGRAHPRDPTNRTGRLRVKIKKEDGTPANPLYPSKAAVLRKCGEEIPGLELRKKREVAIAKQLEEQQKRLAPPGSTAAAAPASSGSNKKKKGKKKR